MTTANRRRKYLSRLKNRLCVTCGSPLAEYGYVDCPQCRNYKAQCGRKWRLDRSQKKWNKIVDRGLVIMTEATRLSGFNRKTIFRLIKEGNLNTYGKWGKQALISYAELVKVIRRRPWLRCLRCNHVWRSRGALNDCPKCSSPKIKKLSPRELEYYRLGAK